MARSPTIPPDAVDRLVLLICSGVTSEKLIEAAGTLGIADGHRAKAIAAARKKITIAADYDRAAEIGTAYTRLNDLHRRALAVQDVKSSLAAVKELNKLLGLYPDEAAAKGAVGHGQVPKEVAEACARLRALGLGSDTDGIGELVRLAVARIVQLCDGPK